MFDDTDYSPIIGAAFCCEYVHEFVIHCNNQTFVFPLLFEAVRLGFLEYVEVFKANSRLVL